MKRALCGLALIAFTTITFSLSPAAYAEDFGIAYTVEEITFKRYARS